MELYLNPDLGKITLEVDEATTARAVVIIAHGSGAGMHHPFLSQISRLFSQKGFHAARFNFPYMEEGKKFPGAPKPNIDTWGLVVQHLTERYPELPVFLSGKSYGGRMASHLLALEQPGSVRGVFYLGFPLHAPGRDSMDRAAHLSKVSLPQLFLQGTNDKLANIDLMRKVLADLPNGTLFEIEGADHSFGVPKSSGKTRQEVMGELIRESAGWMDKILQVKT